MTGRPPGADVPPVSSWELGAPPGLRRLWRPLLGLALGLLLLALAVRGVDLQQVWAGVEQADPGWVALALVTVLVTTAAKVARWRGLFPAVIGVSFPSLARALLVGQLANALLPARLGEVARFYLLGRDEGVSKATVVGTIAAEKAFDVLFLLLTAGLAAVLTTLPQWLHGALAGMAALGVAVMVTAVALPRQRVVTLGRRLAGALPEALTSRLVWLIDRGLIGLEALRRPRLAARACAWSAAVWALAAGTNLALFRAFQLDLTIGPALLLLTLLHVGMAPPSSPGRLGVFHAVTVVGLRSFGVGRAVGLAYAAVLHALVYGPQLLLGALALGLRPSRGKERR